MIFKCYYDKTLKMSEGKLAAQVGHATANLALQMNQVPTKIIVLEASHKKFNEIVSDCIEYFYVQKDLGLTEVEAWTNTVVVFAEDLCDSAIRVPPDVDKGLFNKVHAKLTEWEKNSKYTLISGG